MYSLKKKRFVRNRLVKNFKKGGVRKSKKRSFSKKKGGSLHNSNGQTLALVEQVKENIHKLPEIVKIILTDNRDLLRLVKIDPSLIEKIKEIKLPPNTNSPLKGGSGYREDQLRSIRHEEDLVGIAIVLPIVLGILYICIGLLIGPNPELPQSSGE